MEKSIGGARVHMRTLVHTCVCPHFLLFLSESGLCQRKTENGTRRKKEKGVRRKSLCRGFFFLCWPSLLLLLQLRRCSAPPLNRKAPLILRRKSFAEEERGIKKSGGKKGFQKHTHMYTHTQHNTISKPSYSCGCSLTSFQSLRPPNQVHSSQ